MVAKYLKNISKIIKLFSPKDYRLFIKLNYLIMISSIVETVSILSIFPFIAFLTKDKLEQDSFLITFIENQIEIFGEFNAILIIGLFVIVTLFISIFLRFLVSKRIFEFALTQEMKMSVSLADKNFYMKYEDTFLKSKSNALKQIVTESSALNSSAILPLLNLSSNLFFAFFVLLMLIIVEPWITFSLILFLTLMFFLIYFLYANRINNFGKERHSSNIKRYKLLEIGLSAVKEIRINNLQKIISLEFLSSAKQFSNSQISVNVISMIPRYILEAVVIGGSLILLLILSLKSNESFVLTKYLPTISVFLFSSYRLIPAMQKIYQAFSTIKFSNKICDEITTELESVSYDRLEEVDENLPENFKIEFSETDYRYPSRNQNAISGLNIQLLSGYRYACIGETGSGKSTFIDLLSGLLKPSLGTINVINNKKNISHGIKRSWISYAPQRSYLFSGTISNNIAMELSGKDVNNKKIISASRSALIYDEIKSLPNKFLTQIGENGVSLSGGQIQRIALARMFYSNNSIKVYDEACAALNPSIKSKILDSILNISNKELVVYVTHDLEEIHKFDYVILFEKGKIVEFDTPENVSKNSAIFKKLES